MSVPDGAWPMDEHAVYSTIRWLQSQQQNQRFDHLNSLHINMESRIGSLFTDSCCELLLPEKLFQSMLVTASLWPLQTCELTGYLDITSIAMLLPDRLQHLRICPDDDCFPDVVSLSLFARFTQLKTLCIVSLPEHEVPEDVVTTAFLLNHTFPSLETLTLDPWPVQIPEGHIPAVCFPALHNMFLHSPADQAECMLSIPKLKCLGIVLRDLPPIPGDQCRRWASMTITAACMLCKLWLIGPEETNFELKAQEKPDIEIRHYGIGGRGNQYHAGPKSSYQFSSDVRHWEKLTGCLFHVWIFEMLRVLGVVHGP